MYVDSYLQVCANCRTNVGVDIVSLTMNIEAVSSAWRLASFPMSECSGHLLPHSPYFVLLPVFSFEKPELMKCASASCRRLQTASPQTLLVVIFTLSNYRLHLQLEDFRLLDVRVFDLLLCSPRCVPTRSFSAFFRACTHVLYVHRYTGRLNLGILLLLLHKYVRPLLFG